MTGPHGGLSQLKVTTEDRTCHVMLSLPRQEGDTTVPGYMSTDSYHITSLFGNCKVAEPSYSAAI
jgi:hypothetical protein